MWISFKIWVKDTLKIDPLKSFVQLWIVWSVVIFLVVVAFIIGAIITYNSELDTNGSYIGFNSFIEIYKVPLGVLALIIPFTAFLATTHRSVQAKEQIISSNKQNVFVNYYKHIEEFEKFMLSSISQKLLIFNNLRLTHKYLFPYAMEGDYSINSQALELIQTQYYVIKNFILDLSNNRFNSSLEIIFSIYSRIDNIYLELNLGRSEGGRRLVIKNEKVVVPDMDLKSTLIGIKKYSNILINILSFDPFVDIPDDLEVVASMDLENVPDVSNITSVQKLKPFELFNNV